MAQTLTVLLWKTYILRKRRWFVTLVEICIPLILFWLLTYCKKKLPQLDKKVEYDLYPLKYNQYNQVNDVYKCNIAYSPPNSMTDPLMSQVLDKLPSRGVTKVQLVAKSDEDEVLSWLQEQYLKETSNNTSAGVSPDNDVTLGVGVVFFQLDKNNLNYTLRTITEDLKTTRDTIYGQSDVQFNSYAHSGFLTIQSLIDSEFLHMFYNDYTVSDNVLVQNLPYISGDMDIMFYIIPFFLYTGLAFIMSPLMKCIVEEKVSGIREMMQVMGLRRWVNWINWAFYSLLVFVPLSFVITTLLTLDMGDGPVVLSNFMLLWFLLLLFGLAFLGLVFTFSTFFRNGTIAIIVTKIVWIVSCILLNNNVISKPDKFSLEVHLLTCLWPYVPLQWSINTLNNFKNNDVTWTLSDLFDDGAGGGRVSVGLAAVMLCFDIVFYGVLLWYFDSVNPGPYGRAKPYSFIFQSFKNEEYNPNASYDRGPQDNYEPAPEGVKVGIRIENLHKIFNYGRVVAVENVDLDIYEGNITALLGHNGAGKSTTMSILAGFISPTEGRVIVRDKNIFEDMDKFRSSLGLCPQHDLLFSFFTVREHLLFFGMLKGMLMSEAEREAIQLLRTLQIDAKKDSLVSELSGGMKRKVCLAIALIGDPEVLMLDEPTSGLDPQSRRQVWDMLLGFRGQRTTIITTHSMEEADVLGDRIAIMGHGQVKCYGTTMFLKKLYGTGYQVHVSKQDQASEAAITRVVEENVEGAIVKQMSPSQLSYTIRADQCPKFPQLFLALDSWRSELGVEGVSVACTTMEDVFLSVADEGFGIYDETNEGQVNTELFVEKYDKVTGYGKCFLQLQALIYKRSVTKFRTKISSLTFIVIPLLLMAYFVSKSMDLGDSGSQPSLPINLASFPGVHLGEKCDNQTISSTILNLASGRAVIEYIPSEKSLDQYMGELLTNNTMDYERQIIAGIEFNSTAFIAAFSRYFVHSPPLAFNLLANILLRLLNPSASISVFSHPIVFKNAEDLCKLSKLAEYNVMIIFSFNISILSLGLLVLVMSSISVPLKERVSNFKMLQLMSGLSPLLYWFTNLLFDFAVYAITSALLIASVAIFQRYDIYTSSGNMGTLVLVLVLFGFSGTVFAYFFSFLVRSDIKAAVLFVMLNFFTGIIPTVILSILVKFFDGFDLYVHILSLNPMFAASSALLNLFSLMYINGLCVQCGEDCTLQDPYQYMETGLEGVNKYGIMNFLIFLVFDALFYSSLVLMIEYGLMKRAWFHLRKFWITSDATVNEEVEDSDVLKEKRIVQCSKHLRGYVNHTSILCVDGLLKKYNRASTAVKDVTFQVGKGECFGLLGVNGAGKSTTFKMLTGSELPDRGDALVKHHSLCRNKARFLSRVGYCPQYDALNSLLTAREMLRVYALLRGIPSHCRETEVYRWIYIMGLSEYADRPCGTYSGGNKRKLSTAVAFLGNPAVVFLDEPTSGVDPVSRRRLWHVMAGCQQAGQAVVLTSHSMEECEALCNRLTIMVAGRMKCIGTTQHLKQKFGQGYTVKIKLHTSQYLMDALTLLKRDLSRFFSGCSIKDEHIGLLHYHVPNHSLRLSDLFTKMEHLRKRHAIIEDYVVSDTTLEQLFMSFAKA